MITSNTKAWKWKRHGFNFSAASYRPTVPAATRTTNPITIRCRNLSTAPAYQGYALLLRTAAYPPPFSQIIRLVLHVGVDQGHREARRPSS